MTYKTEGRFGAFKAHRLINIVFPNIGRAYEWLKRNTGKEHIHDLTDDELYEINKKLAKLLK